MALAGSRVLEKMAREGVIPYLTDDQEPHPRRALVAQTILALLLLWTASFQQLLTYIGFTLGLSAALTVALSWRHRRRQSAGAGVHWIWTILTFGFVSCILGSTFFTVLQRPIESGVGLATLSLGWVVWYWKYRRSHRKSAAQ
jgi:APA family basic amino acid/polyamine antiporter